MLIPFGVFSAAGAGGGGGGAASYELISTTVLGSSAASVSFSSIDQTYKHLQVRYTIRGSDALSSGNFGFRLNADTTNYRSHYLLGNGSSVSSSDLSGETNIFAGIYPAANQSSGIFTAGILDVLDYASSSKNKTIRNFHGLNSGLSRVYLNSGLWMSTSSITSLTILDRSTQTFAAGSRFSLYGVKG